MTDGKNLNVEFLVRLRKIDKSGLTSRDVLLLYTIITHPGIHGHDAGKKIGVVERSSVSFGLNRLVKRGFIEDRREARLVGRGVPNQLYALPAGVEFWNDLKMPEQ